MDKKSPTPGGDDTDDIGDGEDELKGTTRRIMMETLVKSSRQSLIWRSLMMMLSRKTNRKKVMKMTTVEDDEDAQEGKLLRRELQSRKRESIFYRSTLGEINSISYIYIIPHLKTSRNASRMLLLQTRK